MTKDPFGGRVSKEIAHQYKATFQTEHGEKVVKDLIQRFHVLNSTYKRGEASRDSDFKEGLRTAVLHIMAVIEVDPRLLPSILKQ